MTRVAVVPLIVAGLLAWVVPAGATTIQGYGAPFATSAFACPTAGTPSAPVVGDHPDAMVRVTFDDLPNASWGWDIDLGEDPFIRNVVEYGGADGTTWWWPAGTVNAGARVGTQAQCYDGEPDLHASAEFYDRPHTPFTFSDVAIRPGLSILGFVASAGGDYVADVVVRDGSLEVTNPDYEIGDDAKNSAGVWRVTVEPTAQSFPRPPAVRTIELGHLGVGLHDLPLGYTVGGGPADGDFSIRVHLRDEPTPPPPPVVSSPAPVQTITNTVTTPGPTVTVPAPSAPPTQTAPVVTSAASKAAPARVLSLTAARTAARNALRARLRGWSVARLACAPTGGGAVRCAFTLRRGGRTARGGVTVARTLHYRLTATVPRAGCHPARSRHCSTALTVAR